MRGRSERSFGSESSIKELHTHRILELLQAPSTGKAAICAAFAEPSGGLEPSTPSLPWRFRSVTRVHARSLAAHILLQIAPFEGPAMRRETSRVSFLMCLFCVRDLLSVLKTPNGDVAASDRTLNLKPARGSSSPTAAAHERYRVGLPRGSGSRPISGRRAAVSSAARPSCRAPWSLQASSLRQRVDRPVCSRPLRRVPGRHALVGVGPAATAGRAWSRSRSSPFRPPF